MLIPNQLIEVKVWGNKPHFVELGYGCKRGDTILVPPEHLNFGSHVKVILKCDICGNEFTREWKEFNKSHSQLEDIGLDYCKDCTYQKVINTNIQRYGVKHVLSDKKVREKIENTNIKKYGSKTPASSDLVKAKMKSTNLAKFGYEYASQNPKIKDKVKQTLLRNYGVEYMEYSPLLKRKSKDTLMLNYGVSNPFQSKEIRKKSRETLIKNYRCEYPMQSEEIRNKTKLTNIKTFGTEYPSQNKDVMAKMQMTSLEKYGVTSYSKTDECKKKIISTSIARYGVEHPIQLDKFKNKANNTLIKNGTVKTSKQQNQLYDMIKEKYPNAILNYNYSRIVMDIFLSVEDIKIDIEYDGWFWHQDQQADIKRDMFVRSNNIKVLRVKSGKKLPDNNNLFDSIDYLIHTEHHYTEIILDDWKVVSA